MADFFYDGSSEFDREFSKVNEWGTEDDAVSYDSGSGFGGGAAYHDFYEMASYELNWNNPSPQSAVCKGTNYNYESDYQVNGYVHDYNCSYSATDIAGMRDFEPDFEYATPNYDDQYCMKYDAAWDELSDCTEYENFDAGNGAENEVDTGFYGRNTEFVNAYVSVSHCPSYTSSTYFSKHTHMRSHTYQFQGHHPTSHSLRKQPQRPSRLSPYVPPHLRQYPTQRQVLPSYHNTSSHETYTTCYGHETDFGHSPSMRNTAAPSGFDSKLDFDSKLELCVKEHELWVKENELWVQERAIIRKDLDSLRSRLDRLIEEEKCKKLEASFMCLERQKLGDNDAVFMDDQGLEEDDIKLIDNAGFIINQESKQNENIMEVEGSQGNEGKTEPSIGLKAAMRCLELQRKFWDIGSFFSVIPAVPIHHFDDPFLLGAKGVHGVPSAYEAACIGEVYSSGLNYFLSSLGAANKGTSKHSFLPYGNELSVSLRRLPMVSWQQHLQSEWIGTISSTWHALWRPPDTRVRVYDSLVRLIALSGSWFGIWRPPDFIFRHERFGSSMVGFYFDKGRPPDSTTSFFVSTAQLRGRSPLKRDGLMYSQKLKDLIENVKSCRDLRGSDLLVNSFCLRTYFNYMFYSLNCKVYIRET